MKKFVDYIKSIHNFVDKMSRSIGIISIGKLFSNFVSLVIYLYLYWGNTIIECISEQIWPNPGVGN